MKTQAWGWLAAAALAAGLNASYHDGGMQWLHHAVDQVEHSSAAVLALADGHADQFLAEARLVSNHISADQMTSDQISSNETGSNYSSEQVASNEMVAERDENPSCPWARAMARVQAKVARTATSLVRLEAMSDRKQADFDRMQARQERLQARIVAQTDRYRAAAAAFHPVVVKMVEDQVHCQAMQKLLLQRESMRTQTIRINLPQMPNIEIPKIDADF